MSEKIEKVENFMKSEGLNTLTEIESSEGYFSHTGCDVCADGLGNTVHDCNGYNPKTGEIQDGYKVCGECLYIVAYGQEYDS